MPNDTVLVVGLGIMGGAIAKSLFEAGYEVLGFDVDPKRAQTAASVGIVVNGDLGELISRCQIVISSLTHSSGLLLLSSYLNSAARRKIVIEMSTLSLEQKFEFRDALMRAGHVALDCPISGTGAQAACKDLAIFASGDALVIEALSELFRSFARCVFDLGDFGNGTRMKLIANSLVAIHNVATAEALLLAQNAGLDPSRVVDCVLAGAGSSKVFQLRAPMMVNRRYEPATMKMSVWKKDLELIKQLASDCQSPVPLFTATLPIYEAALEMGYIEADTAAVMSVLERQGTVTVSERPE
jgi:putative dehydrogenase